MHRRFVVGSKLLQQLDWEEVRRQASALQTPASQYLLTMAWSIFNLFKGKQKRLDETSPFAASEMDSKSKSDQGATASSSKPESAQLLKEWLQTLQPEQKTEDQTAPSEHSPEAGVTASELGSSEAPASQKAAEVPLAAPEHSAHEHADAVPAAPTYQAEVIPAVAADELLPEPEDLASRWAARRTRPQRPPYQNPPAPAPDPWSVAALSPALEGATTIHQSYSPPSVPRYAASPKEVIEQTEPVLGPEPLAELPVEADHRSEAEAIIEPGIATELVVSALEHEAELPRVYPFQDSAIEDTEAVGPVPANDSLASIAESESEPDVLVVEGPEAPAGQAEMTASEPLGNVDRISEEAPEGSASATSSDTDTHEAAVHELHREEEDESKRTALDSAQSNALTPEPAPHPESSPSENSGVRQARFESLLEKLAYQPFQNGETQPVSAAPEPTLETAPASLDERFVPEQAASEIDEEPSIETSQDGESLDEAPRAVEPVAESTARDWSLARSQPAGAPVRFAMLHAVAQRWETPAPAPLPTKRIFVVAGSAIEARRLGPVIRALRTRSANSGTPDDICVCAAGEEALPVRESLEAAGVAVDCNLSVTAPGQSIDTQRARTLNGFGSMFSQMRPQWLVIAGDTLLTAMAALAAYHAHIHVARIDGGPPTENGELHPEEINRQLVDLFSSIHFTETDWSKETLVHEGVPESNILVVGNPSVDALYERCARLGLTMGAFTARSAGVVQVLITVGHRAVEDLDVREIARAIGNLAVLVPGLYEFFWPLPTDQASAEAVHKLLARVPGIQLTPAATSDEYLRFLSECDLVLTDSVDLQEEAPSLGKPVLMLGTLSRRVEAVRSGVVIPVGTDSASIQAAIRNLARKLSSRHGQITNPYGDGKASLRIADFFDGVQVLEFGHTALPKLVAQPALPQLPEPVSRWRLE